MLTSRIEKLHEDMLAHVGSLYGVTPAEIRSKARLPHVSEARWVLVHALMQCGFTGVAIAAICDLDQGSVSYILMHGRRRPCVLEYSQVVSGRYLPVEPPAPLTHFGKAKANAVWTYLNALIDGEEMGAIAVHGLRLLARDAALATVTFRLLNKRNLGSYCWAVREEARQLGVPFALLPPVDNLSTG